MPHDPYNDEITTPYAEMTGTAPTETAPETSKTEQRKEKASKVLKASIAVQEKMFINIRQKINRDVNNEENKTKLIALIGENKQNFNKTLLIINSINYIQIAQEANKTALIPHIINYLKIDNINGLNEIKGQLDCDLKKMQQEEIASVNATSDGYEEHTDNDDSEFKLNPLHAQNQTNETGPEQEPEQAQEQEPEQVVRDILQSQIAQPNTTSPDISNSTPTKNSDPYLSAALNGVADGSTNYESFDYDPAEPAHHRNQFDAAHQGNKENDPLPQNRLPTIISSLFNSTKGNKPLAGEDGPGTMLGGKAPKQTTGPKYNN